MPLSLSPTTPNPDLPPEQFNAFDYAPAGQLPNAYDDRRGESVSDRLSHPAHEPAPFDGGRRQRPQAADRQARAAYGPPFDPGNPDDGVERGLLGLFIGVSLKDQFEFLMSDWVNKGTFAPGLRGTRDPVLGDNSPSDAKSLLPVAGAPTVEITGLSRFVTCRGAAVLLPAERHGAFGPVWRCEGQPVSAGV